jgi:hypothetical protein
MPRTAVMASALDCARAVACFSTPTERGLEFFEICAEYVAKNQGGHTAYWMELIDSACGRGRRRAPASSGTRRREKNSCVTDWPGMRSAP